MVQARHGGKLDRLAKRHAELARLLRNDPSSQTIGMVADELERLALA